MLEKKTECNLKNHIMEPHCFSSHKFLLNLGCYENEILTLNV